MDSLPPYSRDLFDYLKASGKTLPTLPSYPSVSIATDGTVSYMKWDGTTDTNSLGPVIAVGKTVGIKLSGVGGVVKLYVDYGLTGNWVAVYTLSNTIGTMFPAITGRHGADVTLSASQVPGLDARWTNSGFVQLPSGGTIGQGLAKKSNRNFDLDWAPTTYSEPLVIASQILTTVEGDTVNVLEEK
jgi:hypothetical protein